MGKVGNKGLNLCVPIAVSGRLPSFGIRWARQCDSIARAELTFKFTATLSATRPGLT